MGSLKSFIKSVRKAKTIADERTVVRKESASIRTSFRDPNLDQTTRRINISKLLYLYILGEKTHFGQVECLKLLASPRFADKRQGYLAVMLLLDENQEVLTLLTNSLDNDMQHPNTFINGLALTCLGNVASPELARDLYNDVEKIIKTTNSAYLKKKACMVAAKLISKEPDLGEVFMPIVQQLSNDKSSQFLLGVCRMIQEVYIHCPDQRQVVLKLVPRLIAQLKRIITAGFMPDYDVSGVTDPFLQVTILQTLRALATDDACSPDYLEQMNDILTQVASNVGSGKNASHAILYECIKTIFAIKSDQSLRVLGINLLGQFLQHKDNNARYVALEMFLTVIDYEPLAVQRHRATIVGCLSDGDISIRRRALELAFAILDEQNIRVLIREILTFLEHCTDNELKPYITSQITIASSRYAPNEKWYYDTLIRMLKMSGNYITSDILSNILAIMMRCGSGELRKHVVSRLFSAAVEDPSQYSLAIVAVWCLGEFADSILGTDVEVNGKQIVASESAILNLIDGYINNSNFTEAETTQLVVYILTAVIKLSVRFHDAQSLEQLRLILNSRTYDTNLEIQTRAVEYQQIFGQSPKLKQGLLAHMPAPSIKDRQSLSLHGGSISTKVPKTLASGASSEKTADLLDLLDDVPAGSSEQKSQPIAESDLLSDIFGSTPSSQPTKTSASNGLLDLYDTASTQPANTNITKPTTRTSSATEVEAFNDGHLRIAFDKQSFQEGQANIDAIITSSSPNKVDQVQLLFAVPKSQKLNITTTAGSDSLVTSNVIRQALRITGKAGSKVKLRVKVKYRLDGTPREDQFDFAGFTGTL
ncbi:hypothetical_protein [Candidozyma auris]|uniref:hypothetical_protein n=1 Tax=Candidozyma auris TaxID=498019 RepID=UPI000D289CFD|nr:hypothetical_protein [[Candida] auris]QEO23177.1 hypothetical_protein [[Candida] auris]GBL49225.1 hypothetical protein CAJCM15448_14990 [[Candida] auris]